MTHGKFGTAAAEGKDEFMVQPKAVPEKYHDGCHVSVAKEIYHIPLHSVLLHSASAGFLKVQAKTLGQLSRVRAC